MLKLLDNTYFLPIFVVCVHVEHIRSLRPGLLKKGKSDVTLSLT